MDGGSVHGRRPSDNPSIAAVLLHRSEFPGSAKALNRYAIVAAVGSS